MPDHGWKLDWRNFSLGKIRAHIHIHKGTVKTCQAYYYNLVHFIRVHWNKDCLLWQHDYIILMLLLSWISQDQVRSTIIFSLKKILDEFSRFYKFLLFQKIFRFKEIQLLKPSFFFKFFKFFWKYWNSPKLINFLKKTGIIQLCKQWNFLCTTKFVIFRFIWTEKKGSEEFL